MNVKNLKCFLYFFYYSWTVKDSYISNFFLSIIASFYMQTEAQEKKEQTSVLIRLVQIFFGRPELCKIYRETLQLSDDLVAPKVKHLKHGKRSDHSIQLSLHLLDKQNNNFDLICADKPQGKKKERGYMRILVQPASCASWVIKKAVSLLDHNTSAANVDLAILHNVFDCYHIGHKFFTWLVGNTIFPY